MTLPIVNSIPGGMTTLNVNNIDHCLNKLPKIEPAATSTPERTPLLSADIMQDQPEFNFNEDFLKNVDFTLPDMGNLNDGIIPGPSTIDQVNVQETTGTADTEQDTNANVSEKTNANVSEKTVMDSASDAYESDAEIVVRNSL